MLEGFDRYEAEYQRACQKSDERYEGLKSLVQPEKESFKLRVESDQTLEKFKSGLQIDEFESWTREEQLSSIKEYLTQPCFKCEASLHWRSIEDFYEEEGFVLEDDEEMMDLLNESVYYIWGLVSLSLRSNKGE